MNHWLVEIEKVDQRHLIHIVKVCKKILISVYVMNVAFIGLKLQQKIDVLKPTKRVKIKQKISLNLMKSLMNSIQRTIQLKKKIQGFVCHGLKQRVDPACIFSSKVLQNQITKFMTVELIGSFTKFLSCNELWCLVLEHFWGGWNKPLVWNH